MEDTPKTYRRNIASLVSLIAGIIAVLCVVIVYTSNLEIPSSQNPLLLIAYILMPLSGLTAIISGIVALFQIKKSGEAGTGIALIGIILGAIPFSCALLLFIYLSLPLYF
ncbi:MAG: hypothetical protein C3F13_13760 [Anaerolineales bacterium]|nr:DUF4190 domain-containing protein [Anaerolineae bacterium]PWB51503.1 MAG: hypothetical protein C3F13_13760 [Anaerolineales bacterium]